MKNKTFLIALSILFTLNLTGCQSIRDMVCRQYPTKIVSPKDPYLDDNIKVSNERLEDNIDRAADVSAKAVNASRRMVRKISDGVKGISAENPYQRSQPYYRKDFQQDMMAESMKGITRPRYLRGQKYVDTYRSPFIFRAELERGGTDAMTTVREAGHSMLAKQYIDFQKDLEAKLNRAQMLFDEKRYSEALEIVDEVLDLDTSSHEGRILFEKIIRAREEDKRQREEKMRERIAQNERIARYLAEARSFLEADNIDEAYRVAKKALSINSGHAKAREVVDLIELAQFERKLSASGMKSFEVIERMIYKHLKLYQQYVNENLPDLAQKELRKVSALEAYRDRLTAIPA